MVPLSLPLGMFIKFLQSPHFFFPSPSLLSIVLASPLLNQSPVLIPDIPLSVCVRRQLNKSVHVLYFFLNGALSSTHLLPKRQLDIARRNTLICPPYVVCVVNKSKAVRHARTQEALFSCFPGFNLTQCSSNVIHDIIWQQQTHKCDFS